MDSARLLEALADNFARLREVASLDLAARVPTCPEWTVAELARHVANGYLNIVVRRVRLPEQTPAEDLSGWDPIEALDRGYAALTGEFAVHSPDEPVGRRSGETVRFWIRRMAHETAIHRVDAELAVGEPMVPIPRSFAVDGVEEMLSVFLEHETHAFPEDYRAHLTDWGDRWVLVAAGDSGWRVTVRPDGAIVGPAGAGDVPAATVRGEPVAMVLWLWNRGGDVTIDGDRELVDRLRALLDAAAGIS